MSKKVSIALVVLILLLASCAAAKTNYEAPAAAPESLVGQRQAVSATGVPPAITEGKGAYSLDQSAASADRLVIKNATISIYVADPEKSMETISKMAEGMGGFVVSADMYQQAVSGGTKVHQVSMSIRVPAERLDEALATIKAETDQLVISENESSQDVTADYTDLGSRLKNLQAAEQQLQQIMDNATKTEDVLAVYSQLVSVREQIEVIKGQMKYYERSAALSSISIQLIPNAAVQPITIAGWQPKGVAKEALQSLIRTMQSLGTIGIWLVIKIIPTLVVILAPIALIVWGIVSLVRRGRRARKAPAATPQV